MVTLVFMERERESEICMYKRNNLKLHIFTSTGTKDGVADGSLVRFSTTGLDVVGLRVGLAVGRDVNPPIHFKSYRSWLPNDEPDAIFNPLIRTLYPPVPNAQHSPSLPESLITKV